MPHLPTWRAGHCFWPVHPACPHPLGYMGRFSIWLKAVLLHQPLTRRCASTSSQIASWPGRRLWSEPRSAWWRWRQSHPVALRRACGATISTMRRQRCVISWATLRRSGKPERVRSRQRFPALCLRPGAGKGPHHGSIRRSLEKSKGLAGPSSGVPDMIAIRLFW